MTNNQAASGNTADRIGIPDNRINWMKNPLATQIKFVEGVAREDSLKHRFDKSIANPTDKDVAATGMPTPDNNPMQLNSEGKQIDPWPPKDDGLMASKAAPRDDEIRKYRYVISARQQYVGESDEFVIRNSQLLTGTHIYEMVYWQSQLDWIDVREVLTRTDTQGRGRMVYPITDDAPSNRLYFRVYKPTEEQAAKGRKVEFLSEIDAGEHTRQRQRQTPPAVTPSRFSTHVFQHARAEND
jgi:hypothetical protein